MVGTRAAFWVGDPVDLEHREWLGCIAWDGHIGNFEHLAEIETEEEFRQAVCDMAAQRDDFADPANGGWPFPWSDDVFLTDVTYAFFGGRVQACHFYDLFMPLSELLDYAEELEDDPAHRNVPASRSWDSSQPDSIIFITAQ